LSSLMPRFKAVAEFTSTQKLHQLIWDTLTVTKVRSEGSIGDERRSRAPYNSVSVPNTLGVRPHRRAGSKMAPYRRF
jgi:hypothetical protein